MSGAEEARDRSLDVAVIGWSGRFPGAGSVSDLWREVLAGRVLTSRMGLDELVARGIDRGLAARPEYVPVRGLVEDATDFDAAFFGMSEREGELTDPQHRLFLETCWSALEDAGHAPGSGEVIGVFGAAGTNTYLRCLLERARFEGLDVHQLLIGNDRDHLATRVSYKLGLTGPSLTVQTACSSSLVAVHLACQSVLNGECSIALAGGVSVLFPQGGYLHQPGGVMSGSGRCRPFDAAADGVVGGDGAAVVVLRRLADAVADADRIEAVILGSAINNDGALRAGYTAPSVDGQRSVLTRALAAAAVPAASLGYVETHGTGTARGDPIEWRALHELLTEDGAVEGSCAVGALKANIGHLDAASGVAGLIKAALVVGTGLVPSVAGFERPNPLLDTPSPLRVPTAPGRFAGWQRRAAVSSFGIGGTNACVIVGEPPAAGRPLDGGGNDRLLALSANSAAALQAGAVRLAARLEDAEPDLGDVAFTLATGRAALRTRLAVVAGDPAAAGRRLRAAADSPRTSAGQPPPVALLFSGQGGQFPGAAAELWRRFPTFRERLETCLAEFDRPFAAEVDAAVRDSCFPQERLDRTDLAQSVLFVTGWCVAGLLDDLGVRPAVVAGHSAGELAAACAAGAIPLSGALRLIRRRGEAMFACPPGAMLAVGLPRADVEALLGRLGGRAELAAVNGPAACVVAGPEDAVAAVARDLDGRASCRRLRGDRAFHSTLMEPALDAVADAVRGLEARWPRVALLSTLTGEPTGPELADPTYWVRQAREPVRFDRALQALRTGFQGAVAVEVGPGAALSALCGQAGLHALPLLSRPVAGQPEPFRQALAELWTSGVPVDLAALEPGGRRIALPTYAFQRRQLVAAELLGGPAHPRPVAAGPAVPDPAAGRRTFLVGAWQRLLGVETVDDDDDFFELGGDSLTLGRLAGLLRGGLGFQVPVRELLPARTLAMQLTLLRELAGR